MIPYVPIVRRYDMDAIMRLSESLPQIKPTVEYDSQAKRWRVYVGPSRTDFNMTCPKCAKMWAEYIDGWYPTYCYHNVLANGLEPIYR